MGDDISSSGAVLRVDPFNYGNGEETSGGFAVVEGDGLAGGSGQDLQVNNVRIALVQGGQLDRVSLRFGEYGGNVNLQVNGELANTAGFAELNGETVGRVLISVDTDVDSPTGILTLSGPVGSFSVGGQELWLDDLTAEASCADLFIQRVAPRFGSQARFLILTAVIANGGGRPSVATEVEATGPGWDPVRAPLPGLEPGATAEVTLRMPVPEEKRATSDSFTLTVDPANGVEEANERNNQATVRDIPIPASDLVPTIGEGEFVGTQLRITVVVRNGGRAASLPTALGGSAPGWDEATAELKVLAPREEASISLVLDVPEDQRARRVRVTVTADPDDLVREVDEENNSDVVRLAVPASDLVIGALTASVEDGTAVLRLDVENDGAATSSPTIVVATAPGWADATAEIEPIEPGQTVSTTVKLSIPKDQNGADTVFTVTVDPDDDVVELDEANNIRSVSASIPPGNPSSIVSVVGIGLGAVAAALVAAVVVWRLLRRRTRPWRKRPPKWAPGARPIRTGFVLQSNPEVALSPGVPLAAGERYLFWAEFGRVGLPPGSRAVGPAELEAAVFAPGHGFRLQPRAEVGSIRLDPGGEVHVSEVAAPPPSTHRDLDERLWFPVQAPDEAGTHRLRLNLYHRNLLVQSRLVTATVSAPPSRIGSRTTEVVDYSLGPMLDPAHLSRLSHHRLSLFLNRNPDGTHGFSFFGEGSFKSDASFDEHELQDLIGQARGALRRAAWGVEAEWDGKSPYRYADLDLNRLRVDLAQLAIRGFRFYAAIADRLGGGPEDARALTEIMRSPGVVQISTKESPRHLLPGALLYDAVGFDTTARLEEYELCPAFLSGVQGEAPLEEHPCFEGRCPSWGAETTVCPSGFWGYRHAMGMPVNVGDGGEVPTDIAFETAPSLAAGFSTDPELLLREEHWEALQAICEDCKWSYASDRGQLVELLRAGLSHVVYLYCHGGLQGAVPFLQVGSVTARGITPDYLFSQRIRWEAPRALVFINGCRTTSLEPERALEFVSVLVKWVRAAGVIGTEITVFEPLARAFAEESLRRFLAGATIGAAVRGARLALLKQGNPLGLVYIPFVLAGLQMVRHTAERPAEVDTTAI